MALNNNSLAVASSTTEVQLFGGSADGLARAIRVLVTSASAQSARFRVVFGTNTSAASQTYSAPIDSQYILLAVGEQHDYVAPRGTYICAIFAVSSSGTATVSTRIIGV